MESYGKVSGAQAFFAFAEVRDGKRRRARATSLSSRWRFVWLSIFYAAMSVAQLAWAGQAEAPDWTKTPPPPAIGYRYPVLDTNRSGNPCLYYTVYSTVEYVAADGSGDPKPDGGELKEAIRVRVEEWESYKLYSSSGLKGDLSGGGSDCDSGQVAILWKNGNVLIKRDDNKWLSSRGKSRGAKWDSDSTGPNEQIHKDFPIPSGADHVSIVLVYTDIVRGRDADLTDIIGAWNGEKSSNGKWTFTRDGDACPLADGMVADATHGHVYAPSSDHPNNRIVQDVSDMGGPADCAPMQKSISDKVKERTGYNLKPRNPGESTSGYDIEKP